MDFKGTSIDSYSPGAHYHGHSQGQKGREEQTNKNKVAKNKISRVEVTTLYRASTDPTLALVQSV